MSKQWCLNVLQDAIERNGKPEVLNSDQGSQIHDFAWMNFLEKSEIKISMVVKEEAQTMSGSNDFGNPSNIIMFTLILARMESNCLQEYIEYYHQKKHQSLKTSPEKMYVESINNKAA